MYSSLKIYKPDNFNEQSLVFEKRIVTMSPKFFICVALIVIAAECNAAEPQSTVGKVKSLLQKFKDWMKSKLEQFKQKVFDAAKKLKFFRDTLLKQSVQLIHEPINTVEKDLEVWKPVFSEKCIAKTQNHIKQVRTATAKEFFHCANLTNAFVDGAKLISEAAQVVEKLVELCSNVAKAVVQCQPFFTSHGLKCISGYVVRIIQELKEDVPVMKHYFEDMVTVGKDMKAQIQTCLHPSKAKIEKDLNILMTSIRSCAP